MPGGTSGESAPFYHGEVIPTGSVKGDDVRIYTSEDYLRQLRQTTGRDIVSVDVGINEDTIQLPESPTNLWAIVETETEERCAYGMYTRGITLMAAELLTAQGIAYRIHPIKDLPMVLAGRKT